VDTVREPLDRLVARHRADGRMVGLAAAAVDRDGVLLTACHGPADVAAGRPVGPDTVFQIGSISKVFTAVLAVQQWEAGRLDPHVPVREYLPWLPSSYRRISSHQLLSHTSGLASGSDVSPPSPYLAIAAAYPPPYYGNANFQVMGLVVEALAGRPYADVLTDGILAPLGMTGSFSTITAAARPPMAVGYHLSPDDRPFAAGDGLAPAPFFEYTAGDGCLACPIADLAAFARMLLNEGRPVLTPAGFELLTSPVVDTVDTADGESACYGVFAGDKYGYRDLNHGGNMVGYDSMMCVDPATGLGAVTLSTGVADSAPIARGLLGMLRDERAGRPPTLPPPPVQAPLPDYEKAYRKAGAERVVRVDRDRLLLDGVELYRVRDDVFAIAGSPFPVRFGRHDGAVVELTHGPSHWVTGGYPGETGRPHPPEWDAYGGQYRSHNPFEPTFRVLVRNGELLQSLPFGRERRLEPTAQPGTFGIAGTRDVLTFDTLAGDRTLRATLSGCPYYRTMAG
jgi:CubicO group peptidase (beta-lactamase class C family)